MTEENKVTDELGAAVSQAEKNLRAKRTVLRRFFTSAANQFEAIHLGTKQNLDIHVQYNQVVEKAERLFCVEKEVESQGNCTIEDYESSEG